MFGLFSRRLYDESIEKDERLKEIVEESKSKVARYFGIPEHWLNVRYRITNLPEIYATVINWIGNYPMKYIARIGKVLGRFHPYRNLVEIDRSITNSYNQFRNTVTHEFVHVAQEVLGKIRRLPRYMLEEEADYVTQQLA